MPRQETMKEVHQAKLGKVVQSFADNGATKIDSTKNPVNGTWTVVAHFS